MVALGAFLAYCMCILCILLTIAVKTNIILPDYHYHKRKLLQQMRQQMWVVIGKNKACAFVPHLTD